MSILVPKVFHFIWLGGELPQEFADNIATWAVNHPSWEINVWTDSAFPTAYPDLVHAALKPRHAANILRYEILAKHGGVYVDTDFVCQKSIEPIIKDVMLFTAYQYEPEHPQAMNNAFFGCTPGHWALEQLVAQTPQEFDLEDPLNCGPRFFTRVLRPFAKRVFAREMFYPFAPHEHERRHESFPDAYAVHGWASRWMPFSDKRTIKGW